MSMSKHLQADLILPTIGRTHLGINLGNQESNQDLEAPALLHCSHGEIQVPAPLSLVPRWGKTPASLEKSQLAWRRTQLASEPCN